jgi:hypothetical protein
MECPGCNQTLCWGADFDYQDYGIEGEGVVSTYSCLTEECSVSLVEVYFDHSTGDEEPQEPNLEE